MAKKTHYSISSGLYVSLCSRFGVKLITRDKAKVTCKECQKLLSDKNLGYSIAQFIEA